MGSKTIATLNVNFHAGVTEFINDTERAQVKIRDFNNAAKGAGAHGITSVQAISGDLRAMELNWANNVRAAERFIATSKGLAGVAKALYPIAGLTAVGGVLFEMATHASEIYEWFQKIGEAPARIRQGFEGIAQPLRVTNAELAVTDDKLRNEIAKLEHKPVNNLKQALDETAVAAEKLAQTINHDIEEIQKLLEKESIGSLKGLFTDNAATDDLNGKIKEFREKLTDLSLAQNDTLAGKSQAQQQAVYEGFTKARLDLIAKETNELKEQLKAAQQLQEQRNNAKNNPKLISTPYGPALQQSADSTADQSPRIAALKGQIDALQQISLYAERTKDVAKDTGALDKLKAAKPASDGTKDFSDKLRELQNQLDQARDKAKYFGDDLAQKVAAGVDKARASIEALNAKRLSEGLSKLTQPQEGQISTLTYQNAIAEHAYEQDQEMRRKVLEDIRQNAEQKKQAFDLDVRHMADYVGQMEKLAQKEGGLTHEGKLTEADQAHLDANRYLSDAAYGDRDEKFKAQLAAMRAQMRGENTPTDVIEANTQKAISDHALQEKQSGRDMSISDGYKSFFKQMKDNAQSAGQQVQQVLGTAFNGLGEQLTALLSGQKSNWAGFFQSLASSFASAGLNSLFGMLGGALGGGGGVLSGIFGSLGHRAGGGPVNSGSAYVVGERGPELFTPSTSGAIVPNQALSGAGAGGYHQTIQVDARGTDPNLTERNVRRAIKSSHSSAVSSAMMAAQELSRRRSR